MLGEISPDSKIGKEEIRQWQILQSEGEISPINTMLKIYFVPKQMGKISPKQDDNDNDILEISDSSLGWGKFPPLEKWQWQNQAIVDPTDLGEISPTSKMAMKK